MRSSHKILIVILNWNRPLDTIECLESVYKIDYPHFEPLVVDNGSSDDSVEQIKKPFPHLKILKNEKNLGYAAGNNCGIKWGLKHDFEYILLLNNDTVVDPQILNAFINAAYQFPQAGVFGAKIYFYDDPSTIWYSGGGVNKQTLRCFHYGCGETDFEKRYQNIEKTDYACGCALFVKSEVVEKVGMMVPRFFLLWEEIDWCFSIRKAGFDCLFIPEAKVWHKISQSFTGGNRGPLWQYYYFRNRLLFLKRHFSFNEKCSFYLKTFPRECFDLIKTIVLPKTSKDLKKQYRAALRGIFAYFFNL